MSASSACASCAPVATRPARRPAAAPSKACSARNGSGRSFTTRSIRGRCAKRLSDCLIDPRIVPERPELGPRPHLGYTASAIDRAADRRTDDAALAKFLKDDRAGGYVIGGELGVMKQRGEAPDPLFSPAEAAAFGGARETIFLGLVGDAPRFGFGLDPA